MKQFYYCMFLVGGLSACNFLDAGLPDDKIVSPAVYAADKTAAAVLTGLYYRMSNAGGLAGGDGSITLYGGLSADELTLFSGDPFLLSLYQNALTPQEVPCWTILYQYVYQVNVALDGLSASTTLTPAIKKQLLGEAKFIRAFCYFYLVNFFGEVPLLTTGDYKTNSAAYRAGTDAVYNQIITDLTDAEQWLSENYLDATLTSSTNERLRPNRWAAAALLARVYLYTGQWALAEQQAGMVISQQSLYDTVPVTEVFLRNRKEAIWQLSPVNGGENTADALLFVLTDGPEDGAHPVYVSPALLAAFEAHDRRKTNWIGNNTAGDVSYPYPHKYKLSATGESGIDYLSVLRLAEQYLIRAEARTQQNNTIGGLADLNLVRRRAGLGKISTTVKTALLSYILHERQVELFTEWAHRWLDLKRTGQVTAVMTAVTKAKGGSWRAYQQLYPVPFNEIILDANLTQNAGY